MKSDEAIAAEQSAEAKIVEAGLDTLERHSFGEPPEAAPTDEGTPAETTGRPRNNLGQFTTTDDEIPADAETDVVAETEPEQAQDGQDPAVAALLAKYGGNVDKALEAAVHAQRKLGQQSSEVGDLRAQTAEQAAIIAELQGLRADIAQTRQNAPLDQATVDWFDQAMMEQPEQAMQWAQQSGNPLLVQRGLDVWKETDPYGAAVYTNRVESQQMYAQLAAQQQRQAQLPMDAGLSLALQNVLSRNPQFTNYSDHIDQTLQAHPGAATALETAAASGDANKIEQAIETLYSLAVGDTLQSLALQAPTPEADTTTQDVVTPTVAETRDPAPEPAPVDVFKEQFRQEAERHARGIWVA